MMACLFVACGEPASSPSTEQTPAAEPITDIVEATDLAEDGRLIAERNCARCHAIGATGESPNPASPPFREVLKDFDIEVLATDFREHIALGGEEMPEFDFGPKGTDALMAYLLTIEVVEDE